MKPVDAEIRTIRCRMHPQPNQARDAPATLEGGTFSTTSLAQRSASRNSSGGRVRGGGRGGSREVGRPHSRGLGTLNTERLTPNVEGKREWRRVKNSLRHGIDVTNVTCFSAGQPPSMTSNGKTTIKRELGGLGDDSRSNGIEIDVGSDGPGGSILPQRNQSGSVSERMAAMRVRSDDFSQSKATSSPASTAFILPMTARFTLGGRSRNAGE
jgi:hypothetical protein